MNKLHTKLLNFVNLKNSSYLFLPTHVFNVCSESSVDHANEGVKGLLDRDSFASQLAMQMQMERLHPKIEMLFTTRHCRVPCIYDLRTSISTVRRCSSVLPAFIERGCCWHGWDHFKQRCDSLVDWRMKARY